MASAQEHGFGYFGWAWDDGAYSIGATPEADSRNELTEWGKELIFDSPNGIAATSKIATIFD